MEPQSLQPQPTPTPQPVPPSEPTPAEPTNPIDPSTLPAPAPISIARPQPTPSVTPVAKKPTDWKLLAIIFMAISAVLLVASAITIPILALRDNNSDELDQLRADREQIIKAFTEEDECLFPNYLKAIMEREMDWDPSYCDGNRRPSDPEEPYYPTPSTDAEEDSYRKDLVAKGVTAYTEFLANNRGSAPADLPDYYCFGSDDPEDKCQLDPYFTLTGAWSYSINSNISDSNAYKPSGDHIVFFKNSRCSGTTSDDLSGLVTSGSSRQAAIVVRLTNNSYYCQEN